jgi:tRNA pseudouridine55 synthase
MFGFLNIDKPPGITSRDLVNRVQRLVRPHKVGHGGTLDPLAIGVLVVAVGPATRLVEYVQRLPKTYHGTFLLGRTSETEDVEGDVAELPDAPIPAEPELRAALPSFVGAIEQRPPAYSAIKLRGKRAYDLARRGQPVELTPRSVAIQSIELAAYDYPRLELVVRCGSGTYIRSLGRDLARSLGTDAVMSALVRTAIGPFQIEDALNGDNLSLELIQTRMLPPALALGGLPQLAVTADEQKRLLYGLPIKNRWDVTAGEAAAIQPAGGLVAVVKLDGGQLLPDKCFPAG